MLAFALSVLRQLPIAIRCVREVLTRTGVSSPILPRLQFDHGVQVRFDLFMIMSRRNGAIWVNFSFRALASY